MIWDVALRKRYDSGERSFTVDLRFRSDARRLVLFGPSGAGKSQALKMIAGLVTPDAGHVRLDGSALYDASARIDLPPQQRGLGYVFQDYALFPHLTVQQNIAFALQGGLLNPKRSARHAAVSRWLAAFHLDAVAHQYPEQLSGGQRQRTALARALVAQPRALLLDEPFAALDRTLRAHLRVELAALQAQLGIPLILITHDEEDIACLADAVIHIEDGSQRPEADAQDASSIARLQFAALRHGNDAPAVHAAGPSGHRNDSENTADHDKTGS
jgi:molybdate transport system ATP-binding protein